MTRTLVLHIGHYKTGTTALQVFCESNAPALARLGLNYATAQRRRCKHSAYAFALLRAAGVTRQMYGYANPKPPERFWAELFDEVRAAAAPVTLISSEEFMRLGGVPQGMARLRAILDTAPDITVRVIAYLRPIQSHLRSWHNQLVKLGVTGLGFQAALRSDIEPVHYDYALAMQPWADLVGPGQLVIRPYSDALRAGNAMYRDFLTALGFRMPVWPRLPRRDPNPRLDDRLLDLTRSLRAAGLPAEFQAELLARAQAALDAPPAQPPAGTPDIPAIRARAQAGLDAVARLAGPDFPLGPFRADLPQPAPPAELERERMTEFLVQTHAAQLQAAEAEAARLNARLAELEARLAAASAPVNRD